MKPWFTLYFGIFSMMALSNAIVPVLPAFAGSSSLQGAIYAAYYLGAFTSTLPAGLLADRFGRTPLLRAGLVVSVASGIVLSMTMALLPVLVVRFAEGLGAGCFVAAAMAYVNSDPDHLKRSGYFMALLNAGLVAGLVLAGWLGARQSPATGILLFTTCTIIPACTGFFLREPTLPIVPAGFPVVADLLYRYQWLWYTSIVIFGVTGVVASLYPKFSGVSPDLAGIWIAAMSIATIGAVLVVSRFPMSPVPIIRYSAVLMIAGVMLVFASPWGFVIIGALAGVVMIAQMAILAQAPDHQGIAMGLFSTTSYLGMAVLPFFAGFVSDVAGFFPAFCITALFAGTAAVAIGRCSSRLSGQESRL
jgi:MFS family permease